SIQPPKPRASGLHPGRSLPMSAQASVLDSVRPALRNPVVAIVGATGAVGAELIGCLEQRNFPLKSLRLLASERSAGRELAFCGQPIRVEALTAQSFEGVDLALFAAGASRSREFAPVAVRA